MTKQKEMAKIAYNALDEKKGEDIKIIDISEISIMKKISTKQDVL